MNELTQETINVPEIEEAIMQESATEIARQLDIDEEMKIILDVPNKNNLYKDLDLNVTYLNLKNFISGRDSELKKKSIKHLSEKLNVLPLTLFIDLDNLEEVDILAIQNIQYKFLQKLSNYVKKFENDARRVKAKPTTDEDIKRVEDIVNEAAVNIDLTNLEFE